MPTSPPPLRTYPSLPPPPCRALGVLCTSAGHTLNAHIGTAVPKLLALANQPEAGPKEVSTCRGVTG